MFELVLRRGAGLQGKCENEGASPMEMLLRILWAAVSLIAKDGFGGEFGESNEAMICPLFLSLKANASADIVRKDSFMVL
jgi:hypothetical protein